MTAQEIYEDTVRRLSASERLRLAALILNDLAQAIPSVVDESQDWTEQDKRDVTMYALQYADSIYPEEEDLV